MEPSIEHARALDILLNRENPRHEPKRNQQEIIEYLLRDEQVYNLARHISSNGLNPLEIVAVFPDEDGNLVVAEGNRRLCSLHLLNDPLKAPAEQRARFQKLADNGLTPTQIMIAKFGSYEEARPWLKILHDGEQDGIGRRTWRAEQKARFTEKNTHHLTLRLMDYAIKEGLATKADKENIRLTTMTRYLENPRVRNAMGITTTSTNPDVRLVLPQAKFNQILLQFIGDARAGEIHSRSKSEHWHTYAKKLEDDFQSLDGRTVERSIDDPSAGPAPPTKSPTKRKVALKRITTDKIESSEAIIIELNKLGSGKLISIYRSLTTLSLADHPALMTAGTWIFLESLTALHGRISTTSFESYIQGRANSWGLPKDEKREINLSLRYISEHGNAEKHSGRFTSIDAKNLRNHFHVIDSIIARLLQECPR